jgi:hypothetical protein
MCQVSDNIDKVLRPDYTKSWSTVFREIVIHFLGTSTKVATWDLQKQAVITGHGFSFGSVIEVSQNFFTISRAQLSGLGPDKFRIQWRSKTE